MKMQQLTFVRPGLLEWWEVDAPQLQGPGEALVRPIAVATCDLDQEIIGGRVPFVGPFAFGHEGIAEVIEVGDAVKSVKAGNLVVLPFQISCGTCLNCRRGLTANCQSVPRLSQYGMGGTWGGFLSEVVRVPFADAMLVGLPAGMDPGQVASLSDNLPDAWRTIGPYVQDSPDAEVLIVGGGGGGSIGLYAVSIARALGVARIEYLDQNPQRLALAATLGAQTREGPFPRRLGPYAITVDASADPVGLACALRSTAPGGICTSAAIYFGRETPLPLLEMYSTGITFRTGRVQARPIIPKVLDLIEEGSLHPERITTMQVSWYEAIEALYEAPTKLIITQAASSKR
jgi:alcohol dehydrogenase